MSEHKDTVRLNALKNEIDAAISSAESENQRSLSKRAEKALMGSIEHWKRLASGKRQKDENIGANSCPLCRLYNHGTCESCPIKIYNGEDCWRTPYRDAFGAQLQGGYDSREFRAEARKELAFLRKVLKHYQKKRKP